VTASDVHDAWTEIPRKQDAEDMLPGEDITVIHNNRE
jgi:hypothetical protein